MKEKVYKEPSDARYKPTILIWMIVLLLLVFFIWANNAEIDEITRAPGSVMPSSRTQYVESQDGGILESLFVREGDIVIQDQLLASIDKTRFQSQYLETLASVAGLEARKARLLSEAFSSPLEFPAILEDYPAIKESEERLFFRRRQALDDEISSMRSIKDNLEEELSLNLPLLATGDVSRTDYLRLERQVAELNGQIVNLDNSWFQEVYTELSSVESQLEALYQQLNHRRNLLEQTDLRASMSGVIKNINITTVGGVVRAGERVMDIVPVDDDLLIEAKLDPRDIAFVAVGNQATIKIDTYDYTIYGDLSGELVFISADTFTPEDGQPPYYRIRVVTDGRRFSKAGDFDYSIQPGMTASVEIPTGKRTVMNYLLKPVIKTLNESLGER